MLPTAAAPSSAPTLPVPSFPGMANPLDVYGRPQVPPAMQANFDPWALLQALQRRWLLASFLGILAGVGGIAVAYWYLWQPEKKYATAWVWVSPTQPFIIFRPPEEPEGAAVTRLKQEVELAKSYEVIMLALQDPELEKLEDFANLTETERGMWIMSDRYKVYANEKENSIAIVLSSADNERWIVPVCNALQRAYVKISQDKEMTERQARYEAKWLLYRENGGDVEIAIQNEKEKEQRQLALHPGVIENRNILLGEKKDVEKRRNELRNEISGIQADRDWERAELGDTTVTAEEIQAEREADEMLIDMEVRLADLRQDIADGEKAFKDGANNPNVKRYRNDLNVLEKEKEVYFLQLTQDIRQALIAKKESAIAEALKKFDTVLKRKNKLLEGLNAQLNDLTAQLSLLQDPTVDTQLLEAQLKSHEPLLSQFKGELFQMEKERNAAARVVAKPEAVEPPHVEIVTLSLRKVGMVGLGALGFVLASISLLEYRTRRIHTANEVVQGLGLRLLGTIPTWSPQTQRSGYGNTLAYNLWTESVDTARTMVTHAAQAESARVVMVTSATSGEGKTSLASHLASSLARAGHRTLLIDGDLRSPAVHALFDIDLAPGFCEVLRGQLALEQAVRATPARGLFLLTAGQWDSAALQALAQGGAKEAFARLKEQFDYVIVDSSPVLAVADALMIGRHVDGVLLSILRDVSRVPTVYAAYQRLSMLGIRTLGAVVNGARNERYGSWYNAPPTAA